MTSADELSDGHIRLRPFMVEDAPAVYEAIQESKAEVMPWLPDLSAVVSVSEVATWIGTTIQAREDGGSYHFAIVDACDGAFIGGGGGAGGSPQHRLAHPHYSGRASPTGPGAATPAGRLVA